MDMFWAARSHPKPVRRSGRNTIVEDAVLVRRVAAADRTAMQTLFSRHHIAVYRFVLQRLRDKAMAEDVTGEVFLEVWRHAGQFEGRSTVVTWMLAIARRKILAARVNPRGVRSDTDGADDHGRADDPDAPLQARDRSTVLRRCIRRLSAEHREMIDLVYYHEQSMESVAAILGIPDDIAKTRMFSARQRLADELKNSGMDWVAI
jgi:RNA polymerase sigma-70 factor (ECF subfamily)